MRKIKNFKEERYERLGKSYFAEGNYEKAFYYYRKYLKKLKKDLPDSDDKVIEANIKLGDVEVKLKKPYDAVASYGGAIKELKIKKVDYEKSRNDALEFIIEKYINVLIKSGNINLRISKDKTLSDSKVNRHVKSAIDEYSVAWPLVKERNGFNTPLLQSLASYLCGAREVLANSYVNSNKINLAQMQYDELLKLLKPFVENKVNPNKFDYLLLKHTISHGLLFLRQERFDRVVEVYGNALKAIGCDEDQCEDKVIEALNPKIKNMLSNLLHNFGIVLVSHKTNCYEDAVIHLQKAVKIKNNINAPIGTVVLLLGHCLFKLKDYDKALENYLLAKIELKFDEETEYNESKEVCLSNIAYIYELKDDIKHKTEAIKRTKLSGFNMNFFTNDDEILTASVRELDICVSNPSNHSDSSMDDLDNCYNSFATKPNSHSLAYSCQPPPPILKVNQTPDESPEKKYNASIIGYVLLMTVFILVVLSTCMKLDIIKLNKEKKILSESTSVLKEKLLSKLRDIQKRQYGNSPNIVVRESNSKKVKKSMHRYSKDHAHNSMLSKNPEIPIFLDLPGTNTISFTESLARCIGAKGISTNLLMEDFDKNISPQISFLTLSSLCGLHDEIFKDIRSGLFISVQNPMINIIQKYNEINRNPNNSPQYDAEVSNLNLIDFLNSTSATLPENSNALTRAILCKPQAELNDNHLKIVRTFLNEKAYIGDLKDFTDATIKFQRRFKWWRNNEKISSFPMLSVSDCMENHHSTHLEKEERLLQQYDDTNEEKQLFNRIIDANFYDYSIFMDYEKQKKNADFGKNNVINLGPLTRNLHR